MQLLTTLSPLPPTAILHLSIIHVRSPIGAPRDLMKISKENQRTEECKRKLGVPMDSTKTGMNL